MKHSRLFFLICLFTCLPCSLQIFSNDASAENEPSEDATRKGRRRLQVPRRRQRPRRAAQPHTVTAGPSTEDTVVRDRKSVLRLLSMINARIHLLRVLSNRFKYGSSGYRQIERSLKGFEDRLSKLKQGYWITTGRIQERRKVPGIDDILANAKADFTPFDVALTKLLSDIMVKVQYFKGIFTQ